MTRLNVLEPGCARTLLIQGIGHSALHYNVARIKHLRVRRALGVVYEVDDLPCTY
jgi:hypothetical protein